VAIRHYSDDRGGGIKEGGRTQTVTTVSCTLPVREGQIMRLLRDGEGTDGRPLLGGDVNAFPLPILTIWTIREGVF